MTRNRTIVDHWNGHLMCAIDTETTGLIAGYNEICQVCVMPLTWDYLPDTNLRPFVALIRPEHPERWHPDAARVNGLKDKSRLYGIDCDLAYKMFVDWYYQLPLSETDRPPYRKQIIPLAKVWSFDRGFLDNWMGIDDDKNPNIDQYILNKGARDLHRVVHYINDVAYNLTKPIPFPKTSLGSLCERLVIDYPNKHDALGDCEATARCYRKLMNIRVTTELDFY